MIQNLCNEIVINIGGVNSIYFLREMLTSTLRTLINNPVKENFYGKRKKINVLTAFFISYKLA